MEIIINGEALDLPPGFSIEIEDSNPVYNERGSQSIPATVPATRQNNRILSFPARIDAGIDPNNPERVARIQNGAYIRQGVMNITEAGKKEGITFNIGFDNSTAYAKWQTRKLSELSSLPTYIPPEDPVRSPVDMCLDYLYRIYQKPEPAKDDFAVFPLAIGKEEKSSDSDSKYWEILNVPGRHGLAQPAKVNRMLNGELTEVSAPDGYCVSPFLRVWRIIELIFADIDIDIDSNPFKDDTELARLVVLNNAADTVCIGEIRYQDLMPGCSVEEFMNALWVRFGLVYDINFDRMSVTLRFIKDIIRNIGRYDITPLITGYEKITYNPPQYVKLTAQTSIDGAAPACERFEDFIRNLDIRSVKLGNDVSQWRNDGQLWTGDISDNGGYIYPDDPDNPEYPDPPDPDYEPDDDRDDGRDERTSASRTFSSRSLSDRASYNPDSCTLAREFITGNWYKLDSENGKTKQSSSSFFNWDPQTDGLDAFELSSDDEFVPLIRVSNIGAGTGNEINDILPAYLSGSRHYHSYIKNGNDSESDKDSTPLSFLFAYTKDSKTFGRLNAEGPDGKKLILDDGSTPELSLLFQFKDGLFARFWRDFDEILRHGNRTVEVAARLNKLEFPRLDMLSAVRLRNIPCLIDTLSYSLPTPSRSISMEMKLRTIFPQGKYDIKTEQNIPDFAAVARHLEWRLKSDTFGESIDSIETRKSASDRYIVQSGYTSHGTQGDEWLIDHRSAVLTGMKRGAVTWENDSALNPPVYAGQRFPRTYEALLHYDIYEIHHMGFDSEGNDDIELDDRAIGSVEISVEYSVLLVGRWVND